MVREKAIALVVSAATIALGVLIEVGTVRVVSLPPPTEARSAEILLAKPR